jgi:cytochrome b561
VKRSYNARDESRLSLDPEMTLSPNALSTAAGIALVALLYYRRFRRSFGRQPVQPARMISRVVILCVIGALLLIGATLNPMMLAADVGGLIVGLALGWWGLKLTRFERHADGVHYIPHSWFGIVIAVLLLARLAYRFTVLWPAMQAAHAAPGAQPMPYPNSPLTLGLFGLLVGYYVSYYLGVLRVAKKQPLIEESPLPPKEGAA